MNSQSIDDLDWQLKMARNHLRAFKKVVNNEFLGILEQVQGYTMLSIEALYDLYLSVKYVNAAKIPGDIVEVGVWRGGGLCSRPVKRSFEI